MKFDMQKHKEAYLSEARTHINTMNNVLVELEKNPSDKKIFFRFFHSLHTLKSLAATMGYEQSVGLCHAMEDVLDKIRNGQCTLTKCVDLFFKCIDQLSVTIKTLGADQTEPDSSELTNSLNELIIKVETNPKEYSSSKMELEIEPIEKIQAIEVKIEQLDTLVNLAEEFLVNKLKLELIREEIEHLDLPPLIESFFEL